MNSTNHNTAAEVTWTYNGFYHSTNGSTQIIYQPFIRGNSSKISNLFPMSFCKKVQSLS